MIFLRIPANPATWSEWLEGQEGQLCMCHVTRGFLGTPEPVCYSTGTQPGCKQIVVAESWGLNASASELFQQSVAVFDPQTDDSGARGCLKLWNLVVFENV